MTELLNPEAPAESLALDTPLAPEAERLARRQLRGQIARLEADLATLFCSTYPRAGFDWGVAAAGGPRVLTLAELERLRDRLLDRLQRNRAQLSERTFVEDLHRRRIEEMLLAPHEHKWERVRNADIGETGCKEWRVVPRLGLVGMLMNWWRVRISSGCPLRRGRGLDPRPAPRWVRGAASVAAPRPARRAASPHASSATRCARRPRAPRRVDRGGAAPPTNVRRRHGAPFRSSSCSSCWRSACCSAASSPAAAR